LVVARGATAAALALLTLVSRPRRRQPARSGSRPTGLPERGMRVSRSCGRL